MELKGVALQVYMGLLFFAPIFAALALFYAHKAAVLAEKNNTALESIWTLLKAVRSAQPTTLRMPSQEQIDQALANPPDEPQERK